MESQDERSIVSGHFEATSPGSLVWTLVQTHLHASCLKFPVGKVFTFLCICENSICIVCGNFCSIFLETFAGYFWILLRYIFGDFFWICGYFCRISLESSVVYLWRLFLDIWRPLWDIFKI